MNDKTSCPADETVTQSADQTKSRCWIYVRVERSDRFKSIVHQIIHWTQQSIGVEHLFFAAMQIKSLRFEEDGMSTFTGVREEAKEKIVYERMFLAGTTADNPEERPPPEPDPYTRRQ